MSEISGPFLAAAIAALVSFVVTLAGYMLIARRMIAERERFDRDLARDLALKLDDYRMEHYARAFELTENLVLKTSGVFLGRQADLIACRAALEAWKTGQVSLIISGHVLKAYRELHEALGRSPGGVAGDGSLFTREQAERVIAARNALRRALREDIHSLHSGDLKDRGLWEG
ncbi:MAG: hypothetical protein AAGF44_10490 [Pseudomonadota bacterium]